LEISSLISRNNRNFYVNDIRGRVVVLTQYFFDFGFVNLKTAVNLTSNDSVVSRLKC
jgi:hypothetical protein